MSFIWLNGKNGTAFYSFWLTYKINLPQTFNRLEDSGKEKEIEEYDIFGNVIKDNHLTLFNYFEKCESDWL